MNSSITFLATSRRLDGLKSSAAIEGETSRTSMMSIPSVSTSSMSRPDCGRANAKTSSTIATMRRMNGMCRRRTAIDCRIGVTRLSDEKRIAPTIRRRCRT